MCWRARHGWPKLFMAGAAAPVGVSAVAYTPTGHLLTGVVQPPLDSPHEFFSDRPQSKCPLVPGCAGARASGVRRWWRWRRAVRPARFPDKRRWRRRGRRARACCSCAASHSGADTCTRAPSAFCLRPGNRPPRAVGCVQRACPGGHQRAGVSTHTRACARADCQLLFAGPARWLDQLQHPGLSRHAPQADQPGPCQRLCVRNADHAGDRAPGLERHPLFRCRPPFE